MKGYMKSALLIFALIGFLPIVGIAQQQVIENHDADKKAALEAVETWLKLIDSGKYAKSWDDAAKIFQDNVPKSDWKKSVEAARSPLGKNVSRKLIAQEYLTEIPGAPDGEYVIIQFTSQFENKKEAMESLTPLKQDGEWKVSGYYVK